MKLGIFIRDGDEAMKKEELNHFQQSPRLSIIHLKKKLHIINIIIYIIKLIIF